MRIQALLREDSIMSGSFLATGVDLEDLADLDFGE